MFIFDEMPAIENVVDEFDRRVALYENVDKWVQYRGMPESCRDAFFQGDLGSYLTPVEFGGGSYTLFERSVCMAKLAQRAGAILPYFSEVTDYALISNIEGGPHLCGLFPMKGLRPLFSEAFTEPSFFDGVEELTTCVDIAPDGTPVLNGRKTFVPNGEFEKGIVVLACDNHYGSEDGGVSLWAVPSDAEGVHAFPINAIGQSTLAPADVAFDNVRLDPSQRVRVNGPLSLCLRRQYELRCLFMAAIDTGLARAAYEEANAFLHEMSLNNASPRYIESNLEKLYDMEVGVQAMELFVRNTADVLDSYDNSNSYHTCKSLMRFVPKTSLEVCEQAMVLLGLRGYSDDARLGRILSDCRGNYLRQSGERIMLTVLRKMFA